ncbi:MAG TPA: hypothetical protein VF775_02465 [Geobacteraceae bacterium]
MNNTAPSTTLGLQLARRLHRALTAGKEELFRLVDDPSMEVVSALLRNPALDANHLLALLKRRDLTEDLVKEVARLGQAGESHEVKVALVRNPATPGGIMTTLLPHLYLFELVNISLLPGVTPDQKVAAERAILQRLPTTPLGNKLTLARRGTAAIVEALVMEGDPRLMEACLDSPRLKESAVFRLLTGAKASAETVSMVARHPRWKGRTNLQLAILRNARTPAVWFTLLLPQLNLADVKGLLGSPRLTTPQKKLVEEELRRRGQGRKGR